MISLAMKQLYYTSCRTGKSVSGSSGFQVRAVSPDLPADRLRAAIAYVGYSLPVNVMPSDTTVATAPVRLALLNTRDAGRLLCHSAYVGKDPMTGRFGNFFSHALLDVPAGVDAGQAIQTWGSNFWRRCDDDEGPNLGEVQELPAHGALKQTLVRFLASEPNRQMLRFALHALLSRDESVRVFIGARAEDVALCIYGVTRALPRSLIGDLTFSTYETEPLTCNARLVGTWWGDTHEMDLPSSCFSGSCVGYNSYTNRMTQLTGSSLYADFAVRALAADQNDKVDKFRNLCEDRQINQADLLDLIYRLIKDGAVSFSYDECKRLMQHAPLAEWIVAEPRVGVPLLEKINARAKDDSEYHQSVAPLVTAALVSRQDSFDKLRGLSQDARGRLSSWLFLHSFLNRPSFSPTDLKKVADGLLRQPDEAQQGTLSRVVKAVTEEMIVCAARPTGDIQPALENFLLLVGSMTRKGPAGTFTMIRRWYSDGSVENWEKPSTFLPALFAVALGASRSDSLSFEQFGTRLQDEVKDFTAEVRRRGGKRTLWMIEYRSRVWDSIKARRRWQGLTAKWISRTPLPLRIAKWALLFVALATVALALEEWKFNRFGLLDRMQQFFDKRSPSQHKDEGAARPPLSESQRRPDR